ncbi:MAG: phosphotransferase [Candidatus Symbiothrix sp.]|jgi:aminoglycoside/choline kinase family phosphotransferase|nr:phosphotransferase [Candidatus Symbiothrix sp.]
MHALHLPFETITKEKLIAEEFITGSGSNRQYIRLKSENRSLIAVVGESIEENIAFIELTKHFRKQHLPVPELLYVSEDKSQYLLQDLGDLSLFNYIRQGRESGNFGEDERKMLAQTIKELARIQFEGAKGLDFSVCYPQPEFDKRTVLWDLNYFKYCFLKPSGVSFLENKLEDDFEAMAAVLLQNPTDTFLYRDFQSRNVMISNEQPYFIDYQGGRKGPIYYDVASFLWQAKANFPKELREELLNVYLSEIQKHINVNEQDFKEQLKHFVLFRTLQVLGAYGYRGYFEKKAHFIESIPFAIRNLQNLLREDYVEYPYLCKILQEVCRLDKFQKKNRVKSDSPLQIEVYSFSYKKGIPEDASGNGGGYVFDCRAIHNPGRYDEYKQLTGLDKPVIDFLEKDGEIIPFLENVYALADKHIHRYIERGFTNLQFSFGCTGGQHRSVYSAQHLAEYIARKYKVKVKLNHREMTIFSNFNV